MNLSEFTDFDPAGWYTHVIQWAVANQIIEGKGHGVFNPNDPVTREQIAKILYGYAVLKSVPVSDSEDLSSYPDSNKINRWTLSYMQWVAVSGLINDRDLDNGESLLTSPNDAQCAEAAILILRFCQNNWEQ